jgi:hypothetical protein
MGGKRNIAQEVRCVNSSWFFSNRSLRANIGCAEEDYKKFLDMAFSISSVDILYPDTLRTIKKDQGSWVVHERFGFKIPYFIERKKDSSSGFCAFYKKKDKFGEEEVRTLVLGEFPGNVYSDIEGFVDKTIDILTKNVLEQRKWFSWPPRTFVQDNAPNYCIGNGLKAGLLVSIAVLSYDILANSKGLNFADMAERTKEWWGHPLFLLIGTTLCCGFLGGGMTGAILENLGISKRADNKRIKDLHEAVKENFKFGFNASSALSAEKQLVLDETKKTRLYSAARDASVTLEKPYFEHVYNAFKTMDKEQFKLLAQTTQEGRNNFEKIVNILSSDI